MNSEYERGWWDCFDQCVNIAASLNYDFVALEKDFNEKSGGRHRSEWVRKPNGDMVNSM